MLNKLDALEKLGRPFGMFAPSQGGETAEVPKVKAHLLTDESMASIVVFANNARVAAEIAVGLSARICRSRIPVNSDIMTDIM